MLCKHRCYYDGPMFEDTFKSYARENESMEMSSLPSEIERR